jgi:hypothetical protein
MDFNFRASNLEVYPACMPESLTRKCKCKSIYINWVHWTSRGLIYSSDFSIRGLISRRLLDWNISQKLYAIMKKITNGEAQDLVWTQFTNTHTLGTSDQNRKWCEHSLHTHTHAQFANAVTNLGRDTDYPEQNLSFFPQSRQENSGTASLPRTRPRQLLPHPVQFIIQTAYQRCILWDVPGVVK